LGTRRWIGTELRNVSTGAHGRGGNQEVGFVSPQPWASRKKGGGDAKYGESCHTKGYNGCKCRKEKIIVKMETSTDWGGNKTQGYIMKTVKPGGG